MVIILQHITVTMLLKWGSHVFGLEVAVLLRPSGGSRPLISSHTLAELASQTNIQGPTFESNQKALRLK